MAKNDGHNGNDNKRIDKKKLEEDILNLEHVINLTKDSITRLNQEFGGKSHPPSIYLQEYRELTDRLDDHQKRLENLYDVREQEQSNSNNDTEVQPSYSPQSNQYPHTGTSYGRHVCQSHDQHFFPTPLAQQTNGQKTHSSRLLSAGGSASSDSPHSPIQQNTTASKPGSEKAIGVIRIYLPNGKTTVGAIPGKRLKEVLLKSARLKSLRDKLDQCSVYRFGTDDHVDWNSDSGILAGVQLELRTEDKSFTKSTRILKANHNFARKTFFSLSYCDWCRKILFQGVTCKMCGFKLHQKCINEVPDYCITQIQILELEKKIRPQTPSPDSPNTPTDTWPVPGSGDFPLYRPRSTSQPSLFINSTAPLGQNSRQPEYNNYPPAHGEHDGDTEPYRHELSLPPSPFHMKEPCVAAGIMVHAGSLELLNRAVVSVDAKRSSRKVEGFPQGVGLAQNAAVASLPAPVVVHRDPSHRRSHSPRRDSNEDWEVPEEEIEWGDKIGSGSYGIVYRCRWHGIVAVKVLNVSNPTPSQLQEFKNEVAVLRKTRHVNILLFMGYTIKNQLCIVTQWCDGSSLYRHLHMIDTKFDMLQTINIARQTAQGMEYLHAKNIIHRDMKSNNIFLLEDYTVKIGDFGLATVKSRWSGSEQLMQPTGSILWMAPEVIRMIDGNPYTFQSDVYAFGVVLYEMTSNTLPYSHIGNRDMILFQVGRGYLSPDLDLIRSDTPRSCRKLIVDCIKKNREDRPLFPQIWGDLDKIYKALPRICRSQSDPCSINRAGSSSSEDFFRLILPKSTRTQNSTTLVSP
uniref:serine/threonine protein kinase isoform X2 n=1 Tax=Ciona intestinalis TaxID=7719 RepID=UPI00089DD1AE|nr:serine/threonine protein kinase isoform X2 [Ciona intestinalis]|eukprot:XP_018671189.1 serine/threonine protein kinase isoform X2 [Ciona intestinalis]